MGCALIILIPLMSGTWMSLVGLLNICKAYHSDKWMRAPAIVSLFNINRNGNVTVCYKYSINNVEYDGSRLFIGLRHARVSERMLQNTSVMLKGANISVYINQNNSSESVLIPGINRATFVSLVMGIGVNVLFIWILILFWLGIE